MAQFLKHVDSGFGRAVALDTRGLQFKSSLWHVL